jgi:hypothetical protein
MRMHGKNFNLKTANKSFKNMAKLKYFRMVVTNQSCIYKEIESRINLGNCSGHSVEYIWSALSLSLY